LDNHFFRLKFLDKKKKINTKIGREKHNKLFIILQEKLNSMKKKINKKKIKNKKKKK
jgi:hypothetical protein